MADDLKPATPNDVATVFNGLFVPELLEASWQAYITLLRFPVMLRLKYQHELVALRDAIAGQIGCHPGMVQRKAEEIVRDIGGLI